MEEFEHENELNKFYNKGENKQKWIELENIKQLKAPLYVFLNVKELCTSLDLTKEVILTMLN
jgi:hypothetical protein